MNTQLLPMGSVVTLKEAQKKLMIVGILIQSTKENKIYDYMAVPFPEGFINTETMFLFYHKDIESVDYLGYVNAESQAYRVSLTKELEKQGIIMEQ